MRKILEAVRARLRRWLGIVYLDKHLSARVRDLERWRDSCIVAVPVDRGFRGKDIIILAGRFGSEDKVLILSVEFGSVSDLIDLAKRLESSFTPGPRFFWDGPHGFTRAMRDEVKG